MVVFLKVKKNRPFIKHCSMDLQKSNMIVLPLDAQLNFTQMLLM
jgi:hypothetical protein